MNPWQGILRLAGLQADFEIVDEKVFAREAKAVYYLRRKKRGGRCSGCGAHCTAVHSTDKVTIRDQAAFGLSVYWVVPRYTLRCQSCQKVLVEDHWLWRSRRRFTWRYECQISKMCEEMTNASVGRLEGLQDTTVYNIDYELLKLRIERQELPKDIGPDYTLDEVYFHYFRKDDPRKPLSFVANLIDLTHKKVIHNAPGRSEASAQACLLALSPEQRAKARSFAMDMHEGFHNGVRALCPQAMIILDRFHIMKEFNEAMNDFRKYQFTLTTDADEKRLLRGSNKWVLLTNPDNLSHKDRGLLDELKSLNERVVEALLIREHFVAFFDSLNEETAKARWRVLERLVIEADIPAFNKFFRDLKRWSSELWNYFRHKSSSAIAEALNHKIKATKAAAYGYRNIRYFQLKICQRVGFLNSRFAPLPQRRPSYV